MNQFKPPADNAELLTIADAYHIVWGAGSLALKETTATEEVKSYQGEEITVIFDRLDQVRDDATAIMPALPKFDLPLITFGSLVEPLTDKIQVIYAQHGVGPDKQVNPFTVNDERITALMGLDIHMRRSRNHLLETRNSSNNR